MKHFFRIIGILTTFITATVMAGSTSLVADNATIRAPIPGMTNTAGYASLTNHSDKPVVLVSAKSTLSKKVEFHDHIMKNGVMKMVKLNELVLKPHQTIEFKSGGLHIMFLGLADNVSQDKPVWVTLIDNQGNEYSQKFSFKSVHQEQHHHHH